MDSSKSVIVASVLAVIAVVGGWMAVPMLQAPAEAVDSLASLHVERARRLLHAYDPQLAYSASVREQLRAAQIEVNPEDFSEEAGEDYKALHGQLWEMFQPTRWDADPPRSDSPSYGNVAGQIDQGITGVDRFSADNLKLLNDALADVNAALAVSVGEASGRTNLEANQLKAVILQQKGLAANVQAALTRGEVARTRDQLLHLVNEADALRVGSTVVADSGIDGKIDALQASIGEAEKSVGEKRAELDALESKIKGLEAKLAAATAEAEETSRAIDKLMAEGSSFADVGGADAYRDRMIHLSEKYTGATRRAHMLEMGGYPNAEIDFSGDYLRGRYLENGQSTNLTVDKGLRHLRLDRDVLAAKIATEQAALDKSSGDLAALRRTRDEYAAAEAQAQAKLAELSLQASEIFAEMNRLASEASALEEGALQNLDEGVSLLQQSVRYAEQWAGDARTRAQALAPEAQERSAFKPRSDDAWLAGQAHAESAGLRAAKSWIYYEQYRSGLAEARVLSAAAANLQIPEADPAAGQAKAEAARKNGIEEIKQAVASLEKAHRGLDRHWTTAAHSAGVTYLLVLFGESDYLADVIQQYRNAVKGRETEPYVEAFAARLSELERRGGAEPAAAESQ